MSWPSRPDDAPGTATASPPSGSGCSTAAGVAVAALAAWAGVAMVRAIVAVGHYEERISAVTHGDVDVLPAWLVYALLDAVLPGGAPVAVVDWCWAVGSLVAAIAFVVWLHRTRDTARRLGAQCTTPPC